MQYYTSIPKPCQESTQIEIPDREQLLLDTEKRKIISNALSEAYNDLGRQRKADYVSHCSDFLTIGTNAEGKSKVVKAYRCRDRLCPICQKVKAGNTYAILKQAIESSDHGQYHYIFLTLTIKNIDGDILREALRGMLKAYDSMKKTAKFSRSISGSVRKLEITYNQETQYHPHIHVILQVKKRYFLRSDKFYITHDQYLAMWKKALSKYTNLESDIIDIRKTKKEDIILELCKYVAKSQDYIDLENPTESMSRIGILAPALHGIRFLGMSGNIKKQPISKEEKKESIKEYNLNLAVYQFNRINQKYIPHHTKNK